VKGMKQRSDNFGASGLPYGKLLHVPEEDGRIRRAKCAKQEGRMIPTQESLHETHAVSMR
jgi:hypothetical protein